MAAWLNEVVVPAVALLSALTKEFDAYYSVVKWQLYKPARNTEYDQQSPRECRYLYCESNSIQQLNNNCGDNPKIVGVGRRLSGSLEQGLVMAPPRARMTNDRSTGVAVRVKLAGIGTGKTVRKQTFRRGI